MKSTKESALGRMLAFGTECFSVFFGVFSLGAYSSTPFFPKTLPRTMRGEVLVYDLLMSGNEDAQIILNTLNQTLGQFFSRNGISLRVSDEKKISLRVARYPGACAEISLLKQGWTLRVPPNLLAGPSYAESEAKWGNIAKEIARSLLAKYS